MAGWRRGLGVALVVIVVPIGFMLFDRHGSAPDYRTMTCSQWLTTGDDAGTVANDYLDGGTTINPQGMADVYDFAATISQICSAPQLASARILDLRPQIQGAFLAAHPQDAP